MYASVFHVLVFISTDRFREKGEHSVWRFRRTFNRIDNSFWTVQAEMDDDGGLIRPNLTIDIPVYRLNQIRI